MMPADLPPAFVCHVVRVYDGDGPITCRNGIKVRVAGVQAPDFERASPCRQRKPGYVCDDAKAHASQRIAAGLVLGKVLDCRPVGRSFARIVARCQLPDGRSLSCALIAAGAATRWDSYWTRYRMGGCK